MTTSLFLAMIACFLAAVGGRDQRLVAQLRALQGPSLPLLMVAIVSCSLTAAAMAWGGWRIEAIVSDSAETMLVAIAMLIAAGELFWPVRMTPMQEPTRSLGAVLLVLLFRQIGDAPRFLVFALAAATASPLFAGLGGAIGGAAAIFLGWFMGSELPKRLPLKSMRYALAFILILVAVYLGLSVRQIV